MTERTPSSNPGTESDSRTPSVTEYFFGAIYLRRKAVLSAWLVAFVCFIAIAFLSTKKYTSSATIQIKEESSNTSPFGLGEGLKMLGARFNSQGTGTTLAILDSRQLAMAMIEMFNLKARYHTKWDHLAIKKFRKNLSYESFDDGIVQVEFTYPSRDSVKIILDSILSFVNHRSVEYSTSKARLEFAFNERQVNGVLQRMDSMGTAWATTMREKGLAELKGNVELALKSYGSLDIMLTGLEEKLALARVDNRISLQDRRSLEAQIASLKAKRRKFLTGSREGTEEKTGDFELSIPYDSVPSLVAWQEKLEMLGEKDKLILKVLVPKLEESRLKTVETTPVINVIDPTFVPPYKSGPKRALIVLIGTFAAGILLTLLLVVMEWYRNPAFVFPGARRFLGHVRRFR